MTIESFDKIDRSLAREWDDLAERSGSAPMLRPGFVQAWWNAFGGHGRFEVISLRRYGRLQAVLPLYERRLVLRAPANVHSEQAGLVAESADAGADLLEQLFARNARRVSLPFVEAEDVTAVAFVQAAASSRRRLLMLPLQQSPTVKVAPDWASFEGTLSRKFLSDLRRRRRRLEELGDPHLDVADGSQNLHALLDEGFRIEPSTWKGDLGTAIVSSPRTRRFYTDVARVAAAQGFLRLAFLRLDGRPLAFQLGLEDGDAYYWLKGGYDREFHRFAPGRLLVQAMLHRAHERHLKRFELLGAVEPWKLEWTQNCRRRILLEAFAPSLAGLADWAAESAYRLYGRPLARWALSRLR